MENYSATPKPSYDLSRYLRKTIQGASRNKKRKIVIFKGIIQKKLRSNPRQKPDAAQILR